MTLDYEGSNICSIGRFATVYPGNIARAKPEPHVRRLFVILIIVLYSPKRSCFLAFKGNDEHECPT
jgi:hypothetical protein